MTKEFSTRVVQFAFPLQALAVGTLVSIMPISVQAQPVKNFPSVDCVVQPYQVVDVGSPVSGVINEIFVERSDFVKQGQKIAHLDDRVERATVQLARARTKVDAQLESERINLQYDRKSKDRVDSLYGRKVISVGNKDEADREAQLSSLRVEQVKDLQQVRELELDRAEQLLDQRNIRSPIDGFVVNRYRNNGEFIEDQPILRIAQLDPLNIEAIVPMKYFGSIVPGMIAEVQPEVIGGGLREAKVVVVDRMGDVASGTFGVRLEMPNPNFEVPAGLKCELRFVPASLEYAARSTPAIAKVGTAEVEAPPAPAREPTPEPVSVSESEPEHQHELEALPAGSTLTTHLLVGPIKDAQEVASMMSIDGIQNAGRQVGSEEVVTWMVLTEDQGDDLSSLLMASGFEDYVRLNQSPYAEHYSLGIFSREAAAESVAATASQSGIATRLVRRVNHEANWWLELAIQNDADTLERIREYGYPVQLMPTPQLAN